MNEPLFFQYLTPLLFPLFPTISGKLQIGLDVQKIIRIRGTADFSGEIKVIFRIYLERELVEEEFCTLKVEKGNVETSYIWREYPAERTGYVEVAVTADRPVFHRIDLPVGYSLLNIPNYGIVTVIPDAKFARPIIIEQMQSTNTFCLVHSSNYWDTTSDSGNSLLFVNPYEQDIVVSVQAEQGLKARARVRTKDVVLFQVSQVIPEGEYSCLMVTANNRIPAWDVRHRLTDTRYINRIDHLDVFRGNSVTSRLSLSQISKIRVRRLMRYFGFVV